MNSILPERLVLGEYLEAPQGSGSHEFTPFVPAPLYAEAPQGFWTAAAQPRDLNSESECLSQNCKSLGAGRLRLDPVLDSSGSDPCFPHYRQPLVIEHSPCHDG